MKILRPSPAPVPLPSSGEESGESMDLLQLPRIPDGEKLTRLRQSLQNSRRPQEEADADANAAVEEVRESSADAPGAPRKIVMLQTHILLGVLATSLFLLGSSHVGAQEAAVTEAPAQAAAVPAAVPQETEPAEKKPAPPAETAPSSAVADAIGSAEEEGPPVPFPALEHYTALWEKSLFTSRDLPTPDAPAGPLFTDTLSLTGVYEVDGQPVAVLVDRTTSQISEARLEVENEVGIKIRKITPGASMDKTRVQLQQGDQAGWVSFADISAPAPAASPTTAGGTGIPPIGRTGVPPGLDTRQPPPQGGLSSPLLPPPAAPGDVPLPPP